MSLTIIYFQKKGLFSLAWTSDNSPDFISREEAWKLYIKKLQEEANYLLNSPDNVEICSCNDCIVSIRLLLVVVFIQVNQMNHFLIRFWLEPDIVMSFIALLMVLQLQSLSLFFAQTNIFSFIKVSNSKYVSKQLALQSRQDLKILILTLLFSV